MVRQLYSLIPVLLAILCAPGAAQSQGTRAEIPAEIEQFLRWLPADTETIIVGQRRLTLPKLPDNLEEYSPTFEDAVRMTPVSMLVHTEDGELLRNAFAGQTVLVAVEGARGFRGPSGLGLMPFDGAQIARFDPRANEAVREKFGELFDQAPEKLQIVDQQVAVFTIRGESDDWSLHFAHPEAGVLIIATDRRYLEEVLQRREDRAKRAALPVDLPEWQHVDVEAPVWAIRHYRQESAATDATSPLNPKRDDQARDPDAVGFVFWYDEPNKTAKARYLSQSPNALQIVREGWHRPTDFLTPEIREIEPGVIEISARISEEDEDDEGDFSYLHVLDAYLGHGVHL